MAKAPAYKSIQMDILNRISDGTLKPGGADRYRG